MTVVASKENAIEVSDGLRQETRNSLSNRLTFLQDFLQAAAKRLPTNEAIERDRKRSK